MVVTVLATKHQIRGIRFSNRVTKDDCIQNQHSSAGITTPFTAEQPGPSSFTSKQDWYSKLYIALIQS
jgi:hypothetical protein